MKTPTVILSILVAVFSLGYAGWKAVGPPASVAYRQPIFEPEHMAQGFRTMSELFPSRTISRGERVSMLEESPRDFSSLSFRAGGKDYRFADLLEPNKTQGLLILHRGRIAYEAYFGDAHAGSRFTSWSVAKSFNSTLVGLAIGDGLIDDVNDQLAKYIPELKGTAYDGVTIRQALQMSSGVEFTEIYDGDEEADVTRFMGYSMFANLEPANQIAASFPRGYEPGTRFNYNTAESQILGWLVATVNGMHPAHILQQRIWQPLGMSHDATWNLDQYGATGSEMGGCCINAALRDYARFGQLFLQDGVWEGERILPEDWVREATVPDSEHLRFGDSPEASTGYQYQWWRLGDDAFAAEGVHWQFIYVNPGAEVVIAKASTWENAWPDDMAHPAIAGFHAVSDFLKSGH